jgi:hypothetical protein
MLAALTLATQLSAALHPHMHTPPHHRAEVSGAALAGEQGEHNMVDGRAT